MQGHSPLLDAHIQAHEVRLQDLLAGQRSAGQGVRQGAMAPSSAEVSRMGTPDASDVGGQAMNLRRGTGSEALPV